MSPTPTPEGKENTCMKAWHEAEESFDYRSRKSTDLWQYIPKKFHPAVADTLIDTDGYWIYLEEGWSAYDHGSDCSIIHEYNISDLRVAIKTIKNYIDK